MAINDVAAMQRPARPDIFERERPRLVEIARRILREITAAEDVAQETLLKFSRSHADDAPYAAAWLRVAAAHAAYDVLRGERRRRVRETGEFWLQRSAGEAAAHAADPAEIWESQERRATVRAVLKRIGKNHAAILALRYSGLSYAQIALALRVSTASVGTRLVRAEAAFTKELQRWTI